MTTTQEKPRSALDAAILVLEGSDKPLSAAEVADAVIDRKLAPGLKGKTPKATIAAQLYTAAKKGKVNRNAKGFTALRQPDASAA